ncbi:MAG: hypothetical protein JSS97_12750 [Actinobacteria bacterium]|nr:hypothetical protein [Actinomycetota bacterium]
MSGRWEYIHVFADGERAGYDDGRGPAESQKQAAERWYGLLNQRGAEGWELVVERYAQGGDHMTPYWAQYAGTMKRRRDQDSA